MRRQELLYQGSGPRLHLLIDEAVLRGLIGTAAVMAGQLGHLQAVATQSAVTVQVIELAKSHSALCSSFTLLSFAGQGDAGCSGGWGGQVLFAKRDTDLAAMERIFTVLAGVALPEGKSAEVLEEVGTWWRERSTSQRQMLS